MHYEESLLKLNIWQKFTLRFTILQVLADVELWWEEWAVVFSMKFKFIKQTQKVIWNWSKDRLRLPHSSHVRNKEKTEKCTLN